MRFRRISFPLSAIASIFAILLYFTHGLNFGIDFVGGTLLEVQSKTEVADLARMRTTLGGLGLGEVQLQQFGTPRDVLIRVSQQPGGDAAQQAALAKVKAALGDEVEYRQEAVVGPRISTELLAYSAIGLMTAIFGILIYLWFRFEWQFALGAMVANVHDLVLTIGFMSLFQIDFDLASIAALLTILGYSLNDTVVIYDRIRETVAALQAHADPGAAQRVDQFDHDALGEHARHRHAGLAGDVLLRRSRDPQLHRHHAVRRGAGRHLYLGVHRGAAPDLFRRRIVPFLDERRRAGARARGGAQAGVSVAERRHLPYPAPIEAYGKGGFRFAGMSHRGSLLCLPDGIWPWPLAAAFGHHRGRARAGLCARG